MKIKSQRVIQFVEGTEFEGTGWHVAENPIGEDRTLCGLAWEGMGHTLRDARGNLSYTTYTARIGQPTCENCLAIIKAVSEMLL